MLPEEIYWYYMPIERHSHRNEKCPQKRKYFLILCHWIKGFLNFTYSNTELLCFMHHQFHEYLSTYSNFRFFNYHRSDILKHTRKRSALDAKMKIIRFGMYPNTFRIQIVVLSPLAEQINGFLTSLNYIWVYIHLINSNGHSMWTECFITGSKLCNVGSNRSAFIHTRAVGSLDVWIRGVRYFWMSSQSLNLFSNSFKMRNLQDKGKVE